MTRWTCQEDEKLRELYQSGLRPNTIGVVLGRSAKSVQVRASRLGIKSIHQEPFWTPEQDAVLCGMYGTATVGQMAEFVGRSATATQQRIARLKKNGELSGNSLVGAGLLQPFTVPSTGILIARTCLICSRLMSADNFYRRGKTARTETMCRTCRRLTRASRRASRGETGADATTLEYQRISKAMASRHFEPITQEDIETVQDSTKTAFQAALELGRTYFAVRDIRQRSGADKRQFPIVETGEWLIRFPNALKELQEHYKRLGPVDESQWEWNDAA